MSKLKTTEGNLLDIVLGIALFVVIALSFSVIKSCITKQELDKVEISAIYEMIDYHGSENCLTVDEDGTIIIKK